MKKFIIYLLVLVSVISLRHSLLKRNEITDSIRLTLWTYQAAHESFYKDMEDEWNKNNPQEKIDLEVSVIPSEDMHNKLLVCATSNTGCPDISDIEIKRFPLFLEGDNDLSTYMDEYDESLVQSRVELYMKDKKNYGIPSHVGAEVIYYNNEIMEEAGVDPKLIVTWEDFIEAGYQVKAKTGKPMIVIETCENLIVWPILVQYNADIIDANWEIDLQNPRAIVIYDKIQELINDGVVIVSPGGKVHSEDFYGYMNNGEIAALPMPTWYMNRFTDYMPDLSGKISVQKYPINPNNPEIKTVGIGGTGTVVFNSSLNKELSAEFITYAKLSDDGSIYAWEHLGFDPVNTDVWKILESPEKFEEYFTNDPLSVLNEYDPSSIKRPNVNKQMVEVSKEINSTMYFELFENNKDAQIETEKTQKRLQ